MTWQSIGIIARRLAAAAIERRLAVAQGKATAVDPTREDETSGRGVIEISKFVAAQQQVPACPKSPRSPAAGGKASRRLPL